MKPAVAFFSLALLAYPAAAQLRGVAHVPLPLEETGTLNGVAYKFKVPANWNGTLLVFAHGKTLGAPAPELAPVASPPVTPSLEERLLEQGYALAGSGFPNIYKQGFLETLALTNYFNGKVGTPARTILWGNSMGGLLTLALTERHPGIYDGAIANCPLAAGMAADMDWALAWALAYAAVFGWRDDWGAPGDLRDNLNYWTDVLPYLQWPDSFENYVKYEFIRRVVKMPPEAFWETDPPTGNPFFGMESWKAFLGAEMKREAGGPVVENIGMTYTLSPEDEAELGAMGLDVRAALAAMNAQTNVVASRRARQYLEQWAGPDGAIGRPVLTMHNIYDGLVPVGTEGVYAARVAQRGNSDKLLQAFTGVPGHCAFTLEQHLAAVAAMNSWLDTGLRPPSSALPASLGFLPDYVPASPWPWPGFINENANNR